MTTVLLIDLSSIAHAEWHIHGNDPNPNATSIEVVSRVRALASGNPHVAICTERGKSFRKELDPTYKANRKVEDRAPLYHQIDVAIDTLKQDGFPVWAADGFEADDVIATAVARLLSRELRSHEWEQVVIASADKDLLQLVSSTAGMKAWAPDGSDLAITPACVVKSLKDGSIIDAVAVDTKFGVRPDQVLDYLALVGDSSDNIKGCDQVGAGRAAGLLKKYGTLQGIYDALERDEKEFTPKLAESLREFQPRVANVRALLTLRTDAPVPFEEVLKERVALDVATFGAEGKCSWCGLTHESGPENCGTAQDQYQYAERVKAANQALKESPAAQALLNKPVSRDEAAESNGTPVKVAGRQPLSDVLGPVGHSAPSSLAVREPSPVEREWQLEPRNMAEMKALSIDLFASRLFSAWGHPSAVLSIILAGREVGIPAMASLRGFHNVEGKPAMHADLIRARVLNSGVVEYFRCTERTNERATFVAKRKGDPEISLTYTIEDARRAWSKTSAAFDASGYGKNPADMLIARCSSKLARLVAPDVVHGFYAPEEFE